MKDVLVSTEWVAAHGNDPGVVLVEVDEDTEAYEKGHIQGAIALHWKDDLQHPVIRTFVDQAGFEQLLGTKGISSSDQVVLYGGNNNWFAAYAYWYFKVYGHANVKLMDGGRKKWELESRELVRDETTRPATTYQAQPVDDAIRAKRNEVAAGLGRVGLIDVRSPEEFAGQLLAPAHLPQEQAQRPGHIPGAANIPWSKAVRDDGTFKDEAELRALYEGVGITPDRDVIAYCRIGERSAHTWFVLRELLEYPNVKNYDGSWTEWGSLIEAPIER